MGKGMLTLNPLYSHNLLLNHVGMVILLFFLIIKVCFKELNEIFFLIFISNKYN